MSRDSLSKEEILRYSRHLMMPEVGMEGQERLRSASVLAIGAGGLGSPVGLYLAAAGVGRIGLVDFDVVEESNLQRQVLYGTADVGRAKLDVARERLEAVNPLIRIETHAARLTSSNAMEILEPYDVVIDGTDNFPTRYLVNDACVLLGKPNVYGSIFRFEGQVSVFDAARGPCYRCLFHEPPPPGLVPSCAEGGVLGILPGIVGTIQAAEAIKRILDKGESLVGRLLLFNALEMSFRTLRLRRDPDCPVCGDAPTVGALIDYDQFCGVGPQTLIEDDRDLLPQELKQRLDRGDAPVVVDVRTLQEWQICRLDHARLIPLNELASRLDELDSSKEVVFMCKVGRRGSHATSLAREAGFPNARNLRGGITAWARDVDPDVPIY
jgi:adenylyltransferase/sulfurtransferase